jgi:biopolymer transport protein ExbB
MDLLATPESWARWLTFAPIIACSVVGLAITIDRWRALARPVIPADASLAEMRRLVETGALDGAARAAEAEPSRGAQLLAAAIGTAGRPRDIVKERVELAGRAVVAELERGLGGLALLASLGPLFGLLGTVVGIVLIFDRLATSGGIATPAELAGGIGTALFTTIAGIAVGILALVFHRYFSSRVERRITQLEGFGLAVVDLVAEKDA